MAMITVRNPAEDSETRTMASRMAGTAMSPSMIRMTIPSSQRT